MPSLEELVSSEESQSPRPFPWLRVAIAAGLLVVLLMAIFLPPLINLGKYRRRITASMSEALGRPVYVGGMQLRLLPTPGIVMSDLTVDEDPAFGSEPALHASSVVASLRITSLWRGRLEVSRISLDDANLNLVRNAEGQWNIGSILLRASQIPNAPTGERRSSGRPRFPYIEATNARIDFKNGVEKNPFSLMNAEFSMWQASSDEWRLRLRAQPVRTDLQLHLSDTGEINIEGSLRRAPVLDAMPVDLSGDWSGAQLGQVTRLIAGYDSGWRGDLDVSTTVRGTLGDLQLQSRLQVSELRRQEFQPNSTMEINATCRSEYHRAERVFDNITCFAPVSGGHLLLTGNFQGFESPQANLELAINKVPAAFPVGLLSLIRPNAQNVSVAGIVNGDFHLVTADQPRLTGSADAAGVVLRYPGGSLNLPVMHFVAPPEQPPPPRRARHPQPEPPPALNAIQLLSLSIPMGEAQPLVVDTRLSRAGPEIHLSGPVSLARLLPAVANLGVLQNATTLVAPRGRATLDLTTTLAWMRPVSDTATGIVTTGTIAVESAELRPVFLTAPVEVQSAEIDFSPGQIAWQNVALTYQKLPMHGSIQFPATCGDPAGCSATFTLATGAVTAADIETVLGVSPNGGFFGKLLNLSEKRPGWPTLQGQVQCEQLDLGPLAMHNVSASLDVAGNTLTFASLDAGALGGTLHWSGDMRIQDGAPHWKLKIHLADAKASAVSELFDEKWGAGQMNADTALSMTGYRATDLASTTAGDFSFAWQNGSLAKSAAGGTSQLAQFDRWSGKGSIASEELKLTSGGVSRGGRMANIRGSINFDRELNLTLDTRRGAEKITGTLAQPVVTGAP